MNVHEKINYVEFPSNDLIETKRFFKQVFGPDYSAFDDQGIDGGFL